MTRIFVGSLPYNTTSDELNQLFSKFGAVSSANVISDKFTGRSRGFGFVEMQSDEEAQKAISELNGYQMDGRALAVSVAKPREERSDRRPYSGGGNDYNRGSSNFSHNRGGSNNRNRR